MIGRDYFLWAGATFNQVLCSWDICIQIWFQINNFQNFILKFVVFDLFKNDYDRLVSLCYLQLVWNCIEMNMGYYFVIFCYNLFIFRNVDLIWLNFRHCLSSSVHIACYCLNISLMMVNVSANVSCCCYNVGRT